MKEINGIKLYDTSEVAELFNVTASTIANIRRKGLLPAVRVGKMLYTSEQSIKDYLNGRAGK